MFRGVSVFAAVFLLGCAGPPSPSLFSSLVLTGSVNPRNTIGLSSQMMRFASRLFLGPDAVAASGAGNPTEVLTQFYRFYASQKDDCSSLKLVDDYGALGIQKDMIFNPVLFSGRPDQGDYKCIAIELDDSILFRPDATAVSSWSACTDVTMQYPSDLYRSDDTLTWKDIGGGAIAARGTQIAPVTDRIFLFASTSPVRVTNGAIGAPANQVLQLNKMLEVPTSFVFYMDFANQVSGSRSLCHLENPTYGIR